MTPLRLNFQRGAPIAFGRPCSTICGGFLHAQRRLMSYAHSQSWHLSASPLARCRSQAASHVHAPSHSSGAGRRPVTAVAAASEPSGAGSEPPFYCGVAMSVYQNSGGPSTNWSAFEDCKKPDGSPAIQNGDRCGVSCNFWDLYEGDIERAASLGGNCFRLSLEWSRIVPTQGRVDEDAVQRYHQIFDCLERHGLEPFVTLHHFVQPSWFDELGGFEEEGNVGHFVDFCRIAAQRFGPRGVRYWTTFNEANVVVSCGWIEGCFPPAKVNQHQLAGRVLGNMYRAHSRAYDAMKAVAGCESFRIGLVHSYMRYTARADPRTYLSATPWHTRVRDRCWASEITRDFFATGEYKWLPYGFGLDSVAGTGVTFREEGSAPGGRPGLDWVGVNYYSRMVFDHDLEATCYPGEIMTTMGYALYAPGLYEGLKFFSSLGLPLYITETGCPDKTDEVRPKFFETYMPQVDRALDEGLDLRGLFHWSYCDNFEWARGFTEHFGLYAWYPGSMERQPRPSVEIWKRWCAHFLQRTGTLQAAMAVPTDTGKAAAVATAAAEE